MPSDLREALRTLLRKCTNDYAKRYARSLVDHGNWMKPEERSTVIEYILSNTGGWRGDAARATKTVLRKYGLKGV